MASGNGSSKKLSRLISRSLIISGLGECATELAKNKTLVLDQLLYSSINKLEMFEGGSVAEGTLTSGSDADRMIVVPDIVVKTSGGNNGDSEKECDIFLLDASKCNPGYALLRLLKKTNKENSLLDGYNISLQDVLEETKEGVFLSSEKFVNFFVTIQNSLGLSEIFFRHGPCATTEHVDTHGFIEGKPGVSKEADIAHAIACCEWPDEAKGWITRKRPHNWPPQSLVERIRKKKCYVVPIGNPLSENYALEWRVSFLLSERELVWIFNDTQLHCYFLLKRLLRLFLETIAPDQLSSYHMKTLLFWLSEEKGLSMWYHENLISCLEVCFDKLFDCVEQKKLQHYFNSHANLLGHKFQNDFHRNQMLEKIHEIRTNITPFLLKCLPQEWSWPGLWEIQSSETINLAKVRRCTDYNVLETNFITFEKGNQALHLYRVMFNLLLQVTSVYTDARYLLRQLLAFENNQLEGLDFLFVEMTKIFLDFRFAMAYFRQITLHEDEAFQTYIDSSSITLAGMMKIASHACSMDKMSGELYLATLHLFFGDYIMSTMIVNALLKKCMRLVYPGFCSTYKTIYLTGEGYSKLEHGITPQGTEGRTNPAFDVIFFYKDIYCVPYPLKFECALSEFEHGVDFVVIHPCVYAYFLLCYGQYLSKEFASFRNTLTSLEKAVHETRGGHERRHALNILAYCCVLDGNLQKAFKYFTESFLESEKLGNVWNAAAFHIAILIIKRLEKWTP